MSEDSMSETPIDVVDEPVVEAPVELPVEETVTVSIEQYEAARAALTDAAPEGEPVTDRDIVLAAVAVQEADALTEAASQPPATDTISASDPLQGEAPA